MKQKALILFMLRMLRTGLSVLNLTITAKYFGVSVDRDVWLLAGAALLIIDQAIWGPVNETFRAKFIFIQHEAGIDAAVAKARSMFLFINGITLLIVAACLMWPQIISDFIAPEYDSQQASKLAYMLKLLSPSLLLTQGAQFLSAVLNAFKRVYLPEVVGVCTALINVMAVILLAPTFGIYSLVICHYLAAILLFIALLWQLYGLDVRILGNPLTFEFSHVKPFIAYALPFFIPYFFGQVNTWIEKALSSGMIQGTVSVIDYSKKFTDITITVLTGILTTMLLPVLSAHFANKNNDEFAREFRSVMQIGFWVMMLLTGLFTACPGAIIALLYNSGTIDDAALNKIATLSMYYSWSAVAVFLYVIFGTALLSTNKGRQYAIYGTLAQIIMIIANLLVVKKLGVYTFSVSLAVSHLIAAAMLYKQLPVHRAALFGPVIKGLAQLLAGCVILYIINNNTAIQTFHPLIIILINAALVVMYAIAYAFIVKTDDRVLIKKLMDKLTSAR